MGTTFSSNQWSDYVFVDEHNRHRRLKGKCSLLSSRVHAKGYPVMRACGACRRRKIKCDAATTNIWPCGPCLKQQLECVPPTADNEGSNDNEYIAPQPIDAAPQRSKQQVNAYYDISTYENPASSSTVYQPQQPRHHEVSIDYASDPGVPNWGQPSVERYAHDNASTAAMLTGHSAEYQTRPSWQPPPLTKAESVASDASWNLSQADPDFISALGDLKISEDAVGEY